MTESLQNRRIIAITAVLAALCISFTSCGGSAVSQSPPSQSESAVSQSQSESQPTAAPSAAPVSSRQDSDENNASYLTTYFGIAMTDTATQGDFVAALLKLQPNEADLELVATDANAVLTGQDAVKYMVMGGNMDELALVYTAEKTAAALSAASVSGVAEGYAPYFACALDLGMISPGDAQALAANEAVSKVSADALLMAAADCNGSARNFLGYSDDTEIYARIMNNWEAFELFDDEKLSAIGSQAVTQQVTTGFNLMSDAYSARFLPELSLRYGHSDIKHAQQLIGLLQSEGIVAKVQFEPKVSIYQYLLEWGEPSEATPTYMVKTISDDLLLAYASEYDLSLEFQSRQDMERLNGLVLEYAKKNTGEEGKQLLYGAWWQPLYVAHVEMGEGYYMIYDNVITNGKYSLHPFCLEEKKDEVLASFKAIDSTVEIVQVPIWCDAPFYRYLNGESE